MLNILMPRHSSVKFLSTLFDGAAFRWSEAILFIPLPLLAWLVLGMHCHQWTSSSLQSQLQAFHYVSLSFPAFLFICHLSRAIEGSEAIKDLRAEVETFGSKFEMPGFEIGSKATANGFH